MTRRRRKRESTGTQAYVLLGTKSNTPNSRKNTVTQWGAKEEGTYPQRDQLHKVSAALKTNITEREN
jgi:hypothetical protein